MTLTAAQARVLTFCARHPGWHSLLEIDSLRLLGDDDVVVIPSLVEVGYLKHLPALNAVAISAAGVVIAGEM